jgi:hypothetical protein
MPNPSTQPTPGGTTEHWQPIANYGDPHKRDYQSDDAFLLHESLNRLVDIRNLLIDVLRAID